MEGGQETVQRESRYRCGMFGSREKTSAQMLHRLMLCDYNIELMLTTIEKELLELPQPFEEYFDP